MKFDIDPETITMWGVKITQAGRRKAEEVFKHAGIMVDASRWADGSTAWVFLFDGMDEANAEKVQELLWDHGFGYVEVVSMEVEV